MCLEQKIHTESQLEGLALIVSCYQPKPKRRSNTMSKRYKRLLLALAAVASIYLVRATGLDQGIIDEVLDAAVEALVEEQPAADVPAAPQGE